jgi:molecular chaperone GrpE
MKPETQPHQDLNKEDREETGSKPTQDNEQQKENTPAEVDVLQKSQAALAEANDKYIRLYAEFDNFRRRAAKEKLHLIEAANENILKQLLPIVDDFERAMAAIQKTNQEQGAESMQQGIQLIHDKFFHLLQQAGVKPMEVYPGSEFNAELHEAVTQTPVEESLKGKVVEVLEKGYYLKDQVLRFAKVVIGA